MRKILLFLCILSSEQRILTYVNIFFCYVRNTSIVTHIVFGLNVWNNCAKYACLHNFVPSVHKPARVTRLKLTKFV